MTTFSQIVDDLLLELRRPDMMSEIQSYVNQTIRDLHFRPDNNAAIFYKSKRVELALTSNLDTGFTWTIPRPDTFQDIGVIRFASICSTDHPYGVYVLERTPGRTLHTTPYYWYRASNYLVFHGYGGVGGVIQMMYYEFPRRLKYYLSADRPASWDVEDGWTYADSVVTDDDKAAAELRVTNWILMRWRELVLSGARAKIYARLSDDSRARLYYSAFQAARMGIYTSETQERGLT